MLRQPTQRRRSGSQRVGPAHSASSMHPVSSQPASRGQTGRLSTRSGVSTPASGSAAAEPAALPPETNFRSGISQPASNSASQTNRTVPVKRDPKRGDGPAHAYVLKKNCARAAGRQLSRCWLVGRNRRDNFPARALGSPRSLHMGCCRPRCPRRTRHRLPGWQRHNRTRHRTPPDRNLQTLRTWFALKGKDWPIYYQSS